MVGTCGKALRKYFLFRILPVTDCGTEIILPFSAKFMNALDRRGEGGTSERAKKCSAVRESVSDRTRRRPDIHEGHGSFQFVMPGLVEEVAEADYSDRLSREVHGQACAGASEGTDDWIQFAAAALQIGASDCEIRGIASRSCYEQDLVWLVPEFMRGLQSGRR
jgi:hypothetical protein